MSVPCGEDFRPRLSTALDAVRDVAGVRWSPARQYHLTLAFLGNWPESRLHELARALRTARTGPGFLLEDAAWGGFPSLEAPRVLFVHWENEAPLKNLAGAVRAVVQNVWPDSPAHRKPFRGHLTVGRVRGILGRDDGRRITGFALPPLPAIHADRFQLVGSELSREGAKHTVLEEFPLQSGA